jgi:hypothetical protein
MKVAIVILAGTETHEGLGRLVNALETAKEMKEAGDELRVVFDGAGTEGLATLSDPAHRRHGRTSRCASTSAGRATSARTPSTCATSSCRPR